MLCSTDRVALSFWDKVAIFAIRVDAFLGCRFGFPEINYFLNVVQV